MNLLFPKRCIGCDTVLERVDRDRGFCPDCYRRITFVHGKVCRRCGKMLRDDRRDFCGDCQKRKHFFRQGKALFLYDDVMKKAMYRFKYANRRTMAKDFAKIARMKYKDWVDAIGIEAIVFVPMYRPKQCERGYNQAEVFARALQRYFDLPLCRLLIRCRDTLPQKDLDETQRAENLKNAFKIKGNIVKFKCVLVVDDIYTTGSTVDEVAKVLMESGVEKVYFLSICIGSDM